MIDKILQSQIIKDYAEFSGESLEELSNKLINHKTINRDEFNQSKDSFDFYETSSSYVYDLLYHNLNTQDVYSKIDIFSPHFFTFLKQKNWNSFAEFGGGLGTVCELVKSIRPDIKITYIDIKSKISDFTLWRWNKNNIDINTIIIPQTDFTLPDTYDIIFTDAVIEHLESNQQSRYIKKLIDYVNKDGLFIPLIDLEGNTAEMPMHFNVDIKKLHEIIELNGGYCLSGRNEFSSVWKKL